MNAGTLIEQDRQMLPSDIGPVRDPTPVDCPACKDGVILYTPDLDIRNLDALPRGRGLPYLEVIRGEDGALVAKRWRRKPPANALLVDFAERRIRV